MWEKRHLFRFYDSWILEEDSSGWCVSWINEKRWILKINLLLCQEVYLGRKFSLRVWGCFNGLIKKSFKKRIRGSLLRLRLLVTLQSILVTGLFTSSRTERPKDQGHYLAFQRTDSAIYQLRDARQATQPLCNRRELKIIFKHLHKPYTPSINSEATAGLREKISRHPSMGEPLGPTTTNPSSFS